MSSLYKLGDELQRIAEEIETLLENGVDPNCDEVQALLRKMVGSEEDWQQKAIRVGHYLRSLQAEQTLLREEEKRLAAKRQKLEKSEIYLHDTLLAQMTMFGMDKIVDPVLTIQIKENPVSVVVHDIDSLPEQYKRRTEKVEADKTRLKADREKIEFEGVEFVKTKKLVMK